MDLREVTEFLRDCMGYIIAAAVVVFILTFVVSIHPIAGNSMTPTLEEGDAVLVSKFSPKLFSIKRNEIVVLKAPDKKTYIKRVIGLPGEKIDYLNGILYVNDEGYRESFLNPEVKTNNFLFEDICPLEKCPDGVIPDGYYLVLGDNRPDSYDSRDPSLGLVSKKQIQGTVMMRIWPLGKMGKVD